MSRMLSSPILLNNALSLGVHLVITIAAVVTAKYSQSTPGYTAVISEVAYNIILIIAASTAYIVCGFFLKPLDRHLFLSVASIPILLVLVFLICSAFGAESGFYYFYANPLAASIIRLLRLSDVLNVILLLLSPLIPSLLVYTGMILRKCFGG